MDHLIPRGHDLCGTRSLGTLTEHMETNAGVSVRWISGAFQRLVKTLMKHFKRTKESTMPIVGLRGEGGGGRG